MEQQSASQQPPPANNQLFRKKAGVVLLLLSLVVLFGAYLVWAKVQNSWPFSENGVFTVPRQSVGDNFQEPSVGDNFQEPSVGDNFQEPSVGDNFQEPSVGDNFQEPSVGDNFQEPSVGDNFQEPSVGDNFQEPHEQVEPGVIALVIKKENYDSLVTEVSTWVKDVERETKNKVEIKIYENDISKEKIRVDLKNLYQSKNLRGVVLIGNIPYARAGIHCSSYPQQVLPCLDFNSVNTGPFGTENLNIDDYFYTDIENKCQYNQELDAFYTDSCSNDSTEQPFWISRLTPPLHNLSDGNRLLKNYFDKNHKFRTGEFSFEHKFLIYSPILLDYENELREANVKNFLSLLDQSNLSPYKGAGMKLLTPESSDNTFFDELSRRYEYVLYNGHGTPFFQQKNINYETVTSKAPKALLYEFGSCSVGRYIEEKYLAGAYLFNTDALIALAAQTPIFVAFSPDYSFQLFLASGKSVGDASRMTNLGAYRILGDGTLRLRYEEKASSESPKVMLDALRLDLGKLSIKEGQRQTILKVKNAGKATLVIDVNTAPPSKLYPVNAVSVSTISSDDLMLQPNETKEIPLNIAVANYGRVYNPSEVRPKTYAGKYSGFFYIYTNDPSNYVIKVPFEGEITE